MVRWPGLVAAAQTLGVSRFHLYRVLRGERTSHRLMREWRQLQRRGERSFAGGAEWKPQYRLCLHCLSEFSPRM